MYHLYKLKKYTHKGVLTHLTPSSWGQQFFLYVEERYIDIDTDIDSIKVSAINV